MIQELLGGSSASLIGGERTKHLPIPLESSTTSPAPTATSSPSEKPNQNQNQHLRCPRCDSSNTKFCYYNNYNLTQPRHFCKTCRRYWTKGGALRNVPIGGGCRKSKNVTIASPILGSTAKPNTGSRLKATLSCEIGKLGFEGYNGNNNHDQLLPSNPILWPPPQNSHILALLRSTQNPNPNPSTTQTLGLGQFNPFWRTNQAQGEQSGFVLGHENQNNAGMTQDLYQRLRSTGNYYQDYPHHSLVATSTAPPSFLESSPMAGNAVSSELAYWNPNVTWSDLPTTNGAYP